jgi:hypothetical protein
MYFTFFVNPTPVLGSEYRCFYPKKATNVIIGNSATLPQLPAKQTTKNLSYCLNLSKEKLEQLRHDSVASKEL